MNEQIAQALKQDRVIDITTTGRKTGQRRRIEIWFHNLADRIFITGMPGRRRSWYANLVANPDFIFHLKESTQADLAAQARPILAEAERREILSGILTKIAAELSDNSPDLEAWVAGSPLVEITFTDE